MRTATWTRIGKDISKAANVNEVLEMANLDYTVEKQPIYLENGVLVPCKVATVKQETNTPIGIVSKNYEIYQNADAFNFIDEVPNIEFVKAGETYNGLVYLIGKLPDVTVLNDSFTPYVIFQNSHNGLYNVKATICPLRIVCQNQFAMSFKRMTNTITFRHSRRLPTKVAQAHQLIIDTAQYMEGFTNTAEELAMLKIGGKDDVYKIIDKFFESTKKITERQQKAVQERKETFINCYNNADNDNFRGTAWGLVNAFTDYSTHLERKKTQNGADSTFMAVTFDTAALTKLMNIVQECV